MSSRFRVVQHTINCQHTREYYAATANGDDDIPKLAVKQYIPFDNPNPKYGDVTIVAAHANGFPKELYEPLWDEIHERSGQQGFRIRGIWIANFWNQGQSRLLNEEILGNDPCWFDHSRDLMNLINQKQDLMPHPLIGIGHSMGGTQLTQLALWHPRLLRSLILLDPIIQIPSASIPPAALSITRREVWPSREAAAESFKKKAFYQAWDPRTLDLWVKHGLREIPTELFPAEPKANGAKDERVTLTTSKHQELFTFLRPTYHGGPSDMYADLDPVLQNEYPNYPYYRPEPALVFRRLPELRPSVLYRNRREGGAVAGRVKNTILDCGHLVGLERVSECADVVAEFLGQELQRWRSDMQVFQQNWKQKPRKKQITMDERWIEDIRPLAQPGKL